MDDLASEVVQQLQSLQAHEDALRTLELQARCRHYTSALRCQYRHGHKTYVVKDSWNGQENELGFGADAAEAAVRYFLAVPDRDRKVEIFFFDTHTQRQKKLFSTYSLMAELEGREEDIATVVRLLPIIESAFRPAAE